MKPERRFTAARLAAISIAGSLLLYADCWQRLFPIHKSIAPSHSFGGFLWAARLEILMFALPFVAGLYLMYAGLGAFRRGVDQAIWSEASLNALRTNLNRGVWSLVSAVLFLIAIGVIFADILHLSNGLHHRFAGVGGLAYFFIAPVISLSQLRQMTRPNLLREQKVWGESMKPIVSDHWGERTL